MDRLRSHPLLLGTSLRSDVASSPRSVTSFAEDDLQAPLLLDGGGGGEGGEGSGGGGRQEPTPARTSSGGGSRGPSRLGTPQLAPPLPVSRVESSPSLSKGSGLLASTVILSKTIMGAGMAALPRAFVMLGLACGGALLLLMAYMTHWSIEALALGTLATGEMSYPQVVAKLCGRAGSLALQLSLVFRCAGLMIVYIIVSADILAGHAGEPGLACDLLGASPAASLCGSRPLAAGLVTALCIAPLVAPKRLASTAITSWVGLVAVGTWAAVTLALAVAAAMQGKATTPALLPDPEAFSGGGAQVATHILAVIPILATAFTCQMTVHHIMRDLRPFSQRRMAAASASAVAVCTAVFLSVAVGSQVAFGRGSIPADVLTLFNGERLAPLVGPAAARVLYVLVRLGFLLSIITIFPMQMAPYKESLARLLVGTELSGIPYLLLTYLSLALFYIVAMHAGTIWGPLQFVGATAGVLIAFVAPAWVALAALRRRDGAALEAPRYWRWNAWALIAIGLLQFGATMLSMALARSRGDHQRGGGGGSGGGGLELLGVLL